jgi:hypothetical protein
MLPFFYRRAKPFTPGAMDEAYIATLTTPINALRGNGSRVFQQLGAYGKPLAIAPVATQMWNGFSTGQFDLQPLVDDSAGGPGA